MRRPLTLAAALLLAFGSVAAQQAPGAPYEPSKRPRLEVAAGIDPFSRMSRGTAYALSAAATWTLEDYDNLRADLGVMGWWIRSSTTTYTYDPAFENAVESDITTDVLAVGPAAAVNARLDDGLWASISVGLGYVPYAAAGDYRSTGAIAWLGVKFLVDDRFSIGITATGLSNGALEGEQYFPIMVGWTFR